MPPTEMIHSKLGNHTKSTSQTTALLIMNLINIVSQAFLMKEYDDGQCFRVKIVEALDQHLAGLAKEPDKLQFRCTINDNHFEEILSYHQIMDHSEADHMEAMMWRHKKIITHEGPLPRCHPSWKGSCYNVMIKWENREVTSEPL